ncbi:MAG: 3-oxoacyl-[acyl-carrier-protein] synthase III C-terminal domain-containing protein [Longimicrobiales bacterium]
MNHPTILATATAVPPVEIPQTLARDYAERRFDGHLRGLQRYLKVFDHSEIDTRFVCEPPDWFEDSKGFAEKNNTYIKWALELTTRVAGEALRQANVRSDEVDTVIFVSSTGLSTPSIDAHAMEGIGLSPHVNRLPMWGLGCSGGVAGLARAADIIRARPDAKVLLIALELCSLTFLFDDFSLQNLVALALFGDGAAAVVLGGKGEGPQVRASRSTTWPTHADSAGWTILDEGMQVVFARELPEITRDRGAEDITGFLTDHGTSPGTVDHFLFHPGGVKVMQAYDEALGLNRDALDRSRKIMRRYGNISSPTALFVLDDLLRDTSSRSGTALLHALGPGFTSENVLLELGR